MIQEKPLADDLFLILRQRHPRLLEDAQLKEIACLPGWLGLLDKLRKALELHMKAHSEITPLKSCV